MNLRAAELESTPLKSSLELVEMLKLLPRDERLRIEGAIIWAGIKQQDTAQSSA